LIKHFINFLIFKSLFLNDNLVLKIKMQSNVMSFIGDLPSENRDNFVLAIEKASTRGKKTTLKAPALYTATHDTAPPPQQVIATEKIDLLFRKLMQKQESRGHSRHKREVEDIATASERHKKQMKVSHADDKGKQRLKEDEEEDEERGVAIAAVRDEGQGNEQGSPKERKGQRNRSRPYQAPNLESSQFLKE